MVTPSALLATAADAVQNVRTNEFDPVFLGKFIVCVIILLGLLGLALGVWSHFRRKPSVTEDVATLRVELVAVVAMAKEAKAGLEELADIAAEFARINESLSGVHRHLSEIDGRLRDGDEVISKLRERQAANAEALSAVKADVHEAKTISMSILQRLPAKRG